MQSPNQIVGFTSASDYGGLVDHIIGEVHSSTVDHYGAIIGCHESVRFLVKSNGLCAIIESHQHAMTNSGKVTIMADNPKKAILEYAKDLTSQRYTLNQGTLTWVQYVY